MAADAPEGQCPACLLLNLTLEPTAVSPTQPAEPPKPPSPPLTPEELAPHFPQLEILECLGRGGMGVVYKARQKSLNRLVALKLLAPEREKDAAFAERFTREAQALALLSHSHIVTVYDFGVTSPSSESAGDGFYYLLMEYVDGVNLRQLLDQRKLTAEEALKIVPPLCDALQFAHERGIVHRDIKPENLLLDRRGQVKIADFGIAKMMGNGTPSHTTGGEPKEFASPALGVTQPEMALGTPAYMAPEQASAPEKVDSRADIYSLGVVFYEMLTGELPARQLDATSSRLRNLHIDVRLDEIVLRALEKKPEMRWQTAADLRTRIEEVSSVPAVAPPVLPSTPGHEDTPAAETAAAPRPFRPWMQRFVARSLAARQTLFWCLLIAGALLTVCFMMPVSKYRAHPALIVPVEQPYVLNSKDEWIVRGEFGIPDAWWSETMRQATVPTVDADGKSVGRTAAGGPKIERSVNLFTWSYALGLIAAIIWSVWWYGVAAEQRAGDRLPPEQRAFAVPLVDRSRGVRIRWWRILTLLLAFCGMSVALSGHMTAIMMLMLGDAPTPIFNAMWTTFFLSFALVKGLGQELVGAPSATGAVGYGDLPVMPHARPNASQRTAAAVGVVTAFVVPFLIYWLNELMGGGIKDRFLISVFLVTWGVSTSLAHWVMRREMLSDAATRSWLRATSVCGWLVSLPVFGFACFSVMSLASESSGWNPAPTEAFIVPAFWLGALLLPLASWYLWRVSGPPAAPKAPPGRSPWRVALGVFMLLAAVAAPLAYVASTAIERAQEQVAFLRQKKELRQRASLDEANRARQASSAELREQHPPPLAPVPGRLHSAELEKLRINLIKWREERKKMAERYLPKHPKMKEMDDRIDATEAVIRALTESAKDFPGAPVPDPPIQDTSDAALRILDWQTFDQAPGQYWRQLVDVRRFREAAELIERYLALHPELAEGARQVNGANLHFHAAQCHAFARNKENALEHLKKSLHRLPSSSQESLLWNFYVNATTFFLLGERGGLLSAYAELAQRAAFNDPNLVTLDRLLAGFGNPYGEAYQADANADHKKLSADFFNRAWELMDRGHRRTAEEDAQMLSYAHASLAHWRQRADCQTKNLSIAYWQISRVYAVLRNGSGAYFFAQLCLASNTHESPYYLGYAYEAMARAASLMKSEDRRLFQKQLASARAQAALVTEAGNRKRLERDLDELEASASSSSSNAAIPGLDAPAPAFAVEPAISTRIIKLTFATPHSQDEVAGWLKSILSGPDDSFEISPDKHSFRITAAPEAMYRAIACLEALDSTEPLVRPSNDGSTQPVGYFCDTATNTARAFIHACAVRDYEAMASVMDLAALGGLKDPKVGSRVSFLRPYLGLSPEEFVKMRAESHDDVPEDLNAAWDILEKEVRGDWPGKREALERLGRQFLQYPVERFALNPTSTDDLAVVRTYYEGSTSPPGVLCIMPQVRNHDVQRKRYQLSRCIPPETQASAGSILPESQVLPPK